MRYDRTFMMIIATPLLGLLIPVAFHHFVKFPASLTGPERELLAPPPPVPVLKLRQTQLVTGFSCPVKPGANRIAQVAKPVTFPPIPLAELAPQHNLAVPKAAADKSTVSMIMMNEGKRMAIISGKVVKEGDQLGKSTVAAITIDRILLKDGKEQRWLNMK